MVIKSGDRSRAHAFAAGRLAQLFVLDVADLAVEGRLHGVERGNRVAGAGELGAGQRVVGAVVAASGADAVGEHHLGRDHMLGDLARRPAGLAVIGSALGGLPVAG